MKKKIMVISFGLIMLMIGLLLGRKSYSFEENIVDNESLIGDEDKLMGSTIAIYVEQHEGQGDYIQKNNVPTENVYVVNNVTHCVGGGYIGYNNSTHKLSYLFDQADECYVYLDKVSGTNLVEHLSNLAIDYYVQDPDTDIVKIKYDIENNIVDNPIDEYTYEEARYIGSNPNNYIWFNCDEFTGDRSVSWFSSHCEKWRIIGVMDENTTGDSQNLVKIIRSDSIGKFSLDYKQSGVGSSTHNSSNDWSDSQLMMMLNKEDYLNQGYRVNSSVLTNTKDVHGREYKVNTETGKVYYASGTDTTQSVMQMTYNENTGEWAGAYYNKTSGCGPASTGSSGYTCNAVDFSINGLRDEAKEYIEPVTWKIGGHSTTAVTTGAMYQYERGTAVKTTDRPTTWYGEIGLMYPTDWALATDLSKETTTGSGTLCKDTNLNRWGGSNIDCYNNWLYIVGAEWTVTPNSNGFNNLFYIEYFLNFYGSGAVSTYWVRPVLYLKASLVVLDGAGTYDNPYMLI